MLSFGRVTLVVVSLLSNRTVTKTVSKIVLVKLSRVTDMCNSYQYRAAAASSGA